MYPTKLEEDYIVRNLTADNTQRRQLASDGMTYRQMSLFDDQSFQRKISTSEILQTAVGQI